MEDYNLYGNKRIVVINDVTVVYTGKQEVVHQEYELQYDDKPRDLGYALEEIVEMYDANGNKFYSNYESIEEAEKAVLEFAQRGIATVIGPKAPWCGCDGKIFPNPSKTAVGVYFISIPKKSDEISSHKR